MSVNVELEKFSSFSDELQLLRKRCDKMESIIQKLVKDKHPDNYFQVEEDSADSIFNTQAVPCQGNANLGFSSAIFHNQGCSSDTAVEKTPPFSSSAACKQKQNRNRYTIDSSATSIPSSSCIIDTRMNTIKTILNSYSTNFTVHGMTKIFHGLLWERILWLTILLSCIGTVTYFTYGFYIEYRHYDISTEFRLKVSPAIKLPTITFCVNEPLSFKSMCYKGKELSGWPCARQSMFSVKIDQ